MPLSLALLATLAAAEPAPFPEYKAMRAMIVKADADLFWGAFEGCDPDLVEAQMLPDFRMIHDKGGLAEESREALVSGVRRRCTENPGYKNRRLLTPGTRVIRPMGDWGALEEATHTFWEFHEGEWQLTGGARYMHVWQWMPEEGKFRLSESLSYDHGAVSPYPPKAD
ncbi:DUF4440 domain-containing protein [Sphingomicrobium nitratireducens]|uniref:DUF4440 domain-containing protein n=1 Tax=Sphingomicrobium nitratireducens TaxID=2964666 RepID=UPI00223E9421|nr:DUF4440 domain-containing protein [Sphingomicrobium nitratireducens]